MVEMYYPDNAVKTTGPAPKKGSSPLPNPLCRGVRIGCSRRSRNCFGGSGSLRQAEWATFLHRPWVSRRYLGGFGRRARASTAAAPTAVLCVGSGRGDGTVQPTEPPGWAVPAAVSPAMLLIVGGLCVLFAQRRRLASSPNRICRSRLSPRRPPSSHRPRAGGATPATATMTTMLRSCRPWLRSRHRRGRVGELFRARRRRVLGQARGSVAGVVRPFLGRPARRGARPGVLVVVGHGVCERCYEEDRRRGGYCITQPGSKKRHNNS